MEVIARINIDSPTGRKLVHEIEKHKKIADLFNIRQLFQILNPCLCYLGYFCTTQKKAFSLRLFADHNSNLGVSGRSCESNNSNKKIFVSKNECTCNRS